MHVIKGGWVGQTFALSTSNDSRGRKSRIRRSKEERKEMVESFINKYQKSNNGNFPSLNLTHKEVGGSFYTVREIVRDIIQENRVLGPAKSFFKEPNNSEFLEQYPLGSMSVEPQTDLLLLDRTHDVTDITPDHYRVTADEHISISNGKLLGPEPFASDNDVVIGHSVAVQKNKGSDEPSTKQNVPIPQDTSVEEVSNASRQFPQPTIMHTAIHHRDISDEKFPQFGGEVSETGTQRPSDEKIVKVDQIFERTKEFEEQMGMEPVVMESPDRDKDRAKELKGSETLITSLTADVVVEKFPLRPLSTIHDADEGSSKSSNINITGASGYKATQHDTTSVDSSSGLVYEKEEKFPSPTLGRNSEFRDEEALKHEGPSLESSNCYSTEEATMLDIDNIKDVEVEHSLPDGTMASDSPEQLISMESTAVGEKPNTPDNDNCWKENNPVLDRNKQEPWEGTSKKTSAPETNALWALLVAFLLALVKFWTK
ncbi:DNA binding [Abeliophyllum distichum]|uniref:DNA binding n=1 Tax=Abeliophyllum distichum TaxID=126358 RepID=A0ABD1NSL7_9LAMI